MIEQPTENTSQENRSVLTTATFMDLAGHEDQPMDQNKLAQRKEMRYIQ